MEIILRREKGGAEEWNNTTEDIVVSADENRLPPCLELAKEEFALSLL
jgi:hypothetical protein